MLVTAQAASRVSNGTGGGLWSLTGTWSGGVVPTSADSVTIKGPDTVTIDISTATASTTTVSGILQFSTTASSSTFTLVQGSMTVGAGGTLTIGTAANPIPASSTATLVLAYGATAGAYGLTINAGGNFVVYGSTRTPWTTATGSVSSGAMSISVNTPITGWSVNDVITVDTEAVTITSISGGTINFTPGLGLPHYSSTPVIVADLSHNAVVRSSGTSVTASTAYIQSLVTNATSFALTYGEFAYLGNHSCGSNCGIDFNGPGSISSSTIRNGETGVTLHSSSFATLTSNNVYANLDYGMNVLNATNNTFTANNVYATINGIGIQIGGSSSSDNLLTSNNVYSNGSYGIYLDYGYSSTLTSNNVYFNGQYGIVLSNTYNNILASNNAYSNGGHGIYFQSLASSNTLVSDNIYSNGDTGLNTTGSIGNVCAGCSIGYSPAGAASQDTTAEIQFDNATTSNLTLKSCLVNPSLGIQTSGFASTGTYLVNYSTGTGIVQVYGDYQLSGSTLTLDYANELFASTATTPVDMSGHGSSAVVVTTDPYTVSQGILITNTSNSDWQVWGSVSGYLGLFTSPSTNQPFPVTGNPQFYLTFTQGSSHAVRDVVNFAISAASQDQNVQKKLQFVQTGTSFNNGRSKLEIATGAGFHAVGVYSAPTLIDWLSSANTFYTFVDSGTLTLGYVTINHADERGLQLTGSGGITMSSSTFDLAGTGNGSSTSTYITANSLTSITTFYGMVFNNTWSSATVNYNVWASTEANLNLYFKDWTGSRGGSTFTKEDPIDNKVIWGPTVLGTCTPETSNGLGGGNWSNPYTWNLAVVPSTCTAVTINASDTVTVDTTTATASTTTVNGTLQFSTLNSSTFTVVLGSVTVGAGGTLTIGTAANPIPVGSTATLILGGGNSPSLGAYGLVVNNGGNFIVYGNTRTPWTTATASILAGANSVTVNTPITGWSYGDVITIDTEAVTITSINSGTVYFTPATALPHYSSYQVVVAELSENAVVQSSGTNTGTNTQFIQDLASNTTSFSLTYGEFDYLGSNNSGEFGIDSETNGKCVISSSTFKYGYIGVYLNGNGKSQVNFSNAYANAGSGLWANTSFNFLAFNNAYANDPGGVHNDPGIAVNASSTTLLSNNVFSNGGTGIFGGIGLQSHNALVVSNNVYSNSGYGITFDDGVNHTLIADNIYNNAGAADLIATNGPNSGVCANCMLGYTGAGLSEPNATNEIDFGSGLSNTNFILKISSVNTSGYRTAGFTAANYLVNYSTTPGVVQVYGDYQLSGSTLTLDYANELYTSNATVPIDMSGHGHTASVPVTVDTAAVSQLITITYTSNANWQVWGSASGNLGSAFSSPITNTPFPNSASPQFYLTFTQGSPAVGDVVNFALTAASQDQNVQKNLQFAAPAGSGFNNNRSELEIAAGGGFHAVGVSSAPTLIDWLSSANTFYTFVDSGTFTMAYATVNHADELGLQFYTGAGLNMSSSTFDFAGSGSASSSSTYITARYLTSNTTFYGMTFNNTWSSATYKYNVQASTEANLSWYFNGWSGARGGKTFTSEDKNMNKVIWGPFSLPGSPLISNVYVSSITATWMVVGSTSGYEMDASTAANFTGTILSSITASVAVSTLTFPANLAGNTTYYVRVGSILGQTTTYANTTPASTSTLTSLLVAPTIYATGYDSLTANWVKFSTGPGNSTTEGYELDVSTTGFNGTGVITSSISYSASPSTLTVSGLAPGTTYFARMGGINWNNVVNYTVLTTSGVTAVPAGCAATTSNGTGGGNWSSTGTWSTDSVPTSCNAVTILSGDTVTIDTTTATASTTTVNGTLQFSTLNSSSFTVVLGSVSVNSGGTLTIGTSANPIPAGSTATLVLAYGATAGAYGLTINAGGNLIVYGSQRTPWTTATGNVSAGATVVTVNTPITGWAVNDVITVDTEAVTITSINGGTVNFTPDLGQPHFSTTPIIVADLSRNAVVLSSGTDVGVSDAGNSAYLENLVTNTTSFNVNYGDFQYLGANTATEYGVDFESAAGSISSSTVRYGYKGIYLHNSANIVLTANNVYANATTGIKLLGDSSPLGNDCTLTSNNVYANDSSGSSPLILSSSYNTLLLNNIFDNPFTNGGSGISILSNSNNLLVSNNVYGNGNTGLGNSAWAVNLNNTAINNTFISDSIYANYVRGLNEQNGSDSGNVFVAGNIGYTSAGLSSPDGINEIGIAALSGNNLVLENSLVNPSPGIDLTQFTQSGNYLLNYSTNTGVLQVYGDYQLSGSTLTLDYAKELYTSSATTPTDMSGHGSVATVVSTTDTYAVSQLITITNTSGSNWQVWGSSSGNLGSTFASPITNQPFPNASTPQFYLTFTQGASHVVGDVVNFALIAASNDKNVQKKLQFAQTGTAFNNGRSELEIASGAGFHAVGASGIPTLIDWLSSANTFYTFVDSGTLTLGYVTINHADERGLVLMNSGGVSMSSSTFDLAGTGNGSSTSTYVTANSLTSKTTFYGMVFNNTWSSATYKNYNVWASTEANLNWYFNGWSGARGGSASTKEDPIDNKVIWGPTAPNNTCAALTSNGTGGGYWSSSFTWTPAVVPSSCTAVTIRSGDTVTVDTTTATASTTTVNGTLQFSTLNSSTFTLVQGSMTVGAGGMLTIGTAANPIPAGSTATLVLAYGATAGQYGLVINTGGNFVVYGSTRTPYTTATANVIKGGTSVTVNTPTGWSYGDLIAIDTEVVTITSINGGTINFTPGTAFIHYSSMPIIVQDLSHNAVVLSSGTNQATNTAYIESLVTNTTSFALTYGEFDYLGNSTGGCSNQYDCGITFYLGGTGFISSSTIRSSYKVYIYHENNITLSYNNFYGTFFDSNEANYCSFVSNVVCAVPGGTSAVNLDFESTYDTIADNYVFLNSLTGAGESGITDNQNSNELILGNISYSNGNGGNGIGLQFVQPTDNNNLVVNNLSYNNASYGLALEGDNNVLIGNSLYSNGDQGIFVDNTSTGNVCYSCNIGYSSTTVSLPDGIPTGSKEITLNNNGTPSIVNVTLYNSLVNPSPGIDLGNFSSAGDYLLNYSTNTGVVQVYGDFQLTGSTLTLDYAKELYTSAATTPMDMSGHGNTASVTLTVDTAAVSQLITITNTVGNTWQVWGSSSGVLGSITTSVSNTPYPNASNPQFYLTFSQGMSHAVGDMVVFALTAASQDSNVQKKLQFAQTGTAFNNGRSKLEIASGGGFHAVGGSSAPTLIDWLSSANTFYTFVDSGTFTMTYAIVNHADERGILLMQSGGVSMSSSTFDYAGTGKGSSTSTYITANNLTSVTTFYGMVFNNTWSSATYKNYNVWASTEANLNWFFKAWSGARGGSASTKEDPNTTNVIWGSQPAACAAETSNGSGGGNWSAPYTWNLGVVPSSCTAVTILPADTVTVDIATATASTTTVSGTLQFSTVNSSTFTLVKGSMTVVAGGTLTIGTAANPIPVGSIATLVLASEASAGQYILNINAGGNFIVYGSTKTPFTTASSASGTSLVVNTSNGLVNWSTGDVITIGQADGLNSANNTERRTIAAISGGNITLGSYQGGSAALAHNHYSTWTIQVGDLTRNAVVRATAAANAPYINSLVDNATSFVVTYAEFANLGDDNGSCINLNGASYGSFGSISSSTIHDNQNSSNHGFFYIFDGSGGSGLTFQSNLVYNNSGGGLDLASDNNGADVITSNGIYSNGGDGIYLNSMQFGNFTSNSAYSNTGSGINDYYTGGNGTNFFANNNLYSNQDTGVKLSPGDTLLSSTIFANTNDGVYSAAGENANNTSLVSNTIYSNGLNGINLSGFSNDTLISNAIYSNGSYGIYNSSSTANLCVGGTVGYNGAQSAGDTSGEIYIDPGAVENFTLKNSTVNPSLGIYTSGFVSTSTYLLSYSTNTGVVQIYGDYQLSGSALTLDYANQLYASTNTTPVDMSNHGSLATVVSTSDTYAVSQLITITYTNASTWQVWGSASGNMGSAFNSPITNQPFPNSSSPQFYLTFTQATPPDVGDVVNFSLIAASQDQGYQKKLQFAKTGTATNHGRSKLEITSGAGFHAVGVSTAPTLIDMMATGGTYYTFVDSGTFTISYATFADADENGVWLNGSGGVSMSSSTFNYAGNGVSSTSTLITVNSVVSNATYQGLEFDSGRSNTHLYNIRILGSDAGISWLMQNYSGSLTGHSNELNDPNNKIQWGYTNQSNGFWHIMD